MILSIKPNGDATLCSKSVDRFFETYIGAVRSFIQTMGISMHDAEDLSQEIFSSIHHSDQYPHLHPDKGRMRAYLKAIAKNRVLEFHRKNTRLKRGGKQRDLSLDDFTLPDNTADPDREFDKKWAYRLLELTHSQLEEDYSKKGRGDLFQALYPSITSDAESGFYKEIAEKLKSTVGAIKVASYRMRQKYREALRSQVALTVGSESEVDEELLSLFKILSGE